MLKGLISQRESRDAYGTAIDTLESSYISYFEKSGFFLQPVSNFSTNINYLFENNSIDIVILSGGGDVVPEYYHNYQGEVQQPNRNAVEKELINAAASGNIPIVGICRGMQFLNGFYGGKISNLSKLNIHRPNGQDHMIETNVGSIKVNNYHNDGILLDDLSSRFSVFALDAECNIVEGFFSNNEKILGLQWHPEREFEDRDGFKYSEGLIKKFISNGGQLDESDYFSGRSRNQAKEIY